MLCRCRSWNWMSGRENNLYSTLILSLGNHRRKAFGPEYLVWRNNHILKKIYCFICIQLTSTRDYAGFKKVERKIDEMRACRLFNFPSVFFVKWWHIFYIFVSMKIIEKEFNSGMIDYLEFEVTTYAWTQWDRTKNKSNKRELECEWLLKVC